MKLVHFLCGGILTVAVASHRFLAALSAGYLSFSILLSLLPLRVFLYLLSSDWYWQAEPLHPLPTNVLFPSVGLSNKPGAGRHQTEEGRLRQGGGGEGRGAKEPMSAAKVSGDLTRIKDVTKQISPQLSWHLDREKKK